MSAIAVFGYQYYVKPSRMMDQLIVFQRYLHQGSYTIPK